MISCYKTLRKFSKYIQKYESMGLKSDLKNVTKITNLVGVKILALGYAF